MSASHQSLNAQLKPEESSWVVHGESKETFTACFQGIGIRSNVHLRYEISPLDYV